jgi:hypothetical protein
MIGVLVKEFGCFRRNRPPTAYKYRRAYAKPITTQTRTEAKQESDESLTNPRPTEATDSVSPYRVPPETARRMAPGQR